MTDEEIEKLDSRSRLAFASRCSKRAFERLDARMRDLERTRAEHDAIREDCIVLLNAARSWCAIAERCVLLLAKEIDRGSE